MQIVLPRELEQLIQRQIAAGKYQSALEVITAGIHLLDQQDDIYQGRLPELQQKAQVGWEAAQRGDLVEGPSAMAQIRGNLRSRNR
ncbi:MAG: ribbon-helix-helix domain-containing protein [Nodosilinea sp.]|jgi:antitoxin ParD1/3/4